MRLLDLDSFVSELNRLSASDSYPLSENSDFKDYPRDRTSRAYLYRGLCSLLNDPPGELLKSITSVREAYDWHVQRAGHARSETESDQVDGARVSLRALEEGDLPELYAASIRPESGFRWRYRGATPSFERFRSDLYSGVLVQHIVQASDGLPIGLVVCYNASLESRTAYFGFIRITATSQEGRMLEGLMLFLRFLFSSWDFRKLYAEVPQFNFDGILSTSTRAVDVEGVLRGHLYHDGKWWDQYLISIWRERWEAEEEIWFGEPDLG